MASANRKTQAMNFRPRTKQKPELNLIPLIDVLIVLLIFLVLTTTFSREASMHVHLPEASAENENPEKKGIEVVIDAEGHYFINGLQLLNNQIETLKKSLLESAKDKQDPLVIISADKATPHQAVMTVLDAAGQLGYLHISFASQLKDKP